jgi:hypothetical protein
VFYDLLAQGSTKRYFAHVASCLRIRWRLGG